MGKFESDKNNRSQPAPVEEDLAEVKHAAEKNLLLYLHDMIYLVAAIVILFLLIFRVVIVSGDSMYNTLWDGDYVLLLSNVLYGEPEYGDVVVVSKASYDQGTPIVKRVIATEGQTVDIDFQLGLVFVDGIALDEPYTYTPTNVSEGVSFPLTVEEGCVFVMGDNRNISKDSRSPEIGLVDTREILGKALFLFFPGTDDGASQRDYDRIGAIS